MPVANCLSCRFYGETSSLDIEDEPERVRSSASVRFKVVLFYTVSGARHSHIPTLRERQSHTLTPEVPSQASQPQSAPENQLFASDARTSMTIPPEGRCRALTRSSLPSWATASPERSRLIFQAATYSPSFDDASRKNAYNCDRIEPTYF